MRRRFQFCLPLIVLLLAAGLSFSQTADKSASVTTVSAEEPVKVELALEGGKTVYRTGEPIKLILSFTATGQGYQLNITTTTPASPVDEMIISPDSKVFHWVEIDSGGHRYRPDYAGIANLSATPLKIVLALNSLDRFDQPGRYTVKIKTSRVHPPVAGKIERFNTGRPFSLETNEVSFEIKPMSAKTEEQEVARLGSLIDETQNQQRQAEYAWQLAFLTGDAATREKVKRFFISQNTLAANYLQQISIGLYIARNKALAIKLFEEKLRDPAVPATYEMIHHLVGLRRMQEREREAHRQRGRQPVPADLKTFYEQEQKRLSEITRSYVNELVGSLPKRSGPNLTTTATTILSAIRFNNLPDVENLAIVRAVLLREFAALPSVFDQERLLGSFWKDLRDPLLLPSLEKILRDYHGQYSLNVRSTVLDRLWDLSPERARPFFVEELKDPNSLVSLDILGKLSDPVLPEADTALLAQIKEYAQKPAPVILREKTLRAARFASPNICDEMRKVYQTYENKWEVDSKAFLLSYLARCNEQTTLPIVEQELNKIPSGYVESFLPAFTKFYFSNGINELLIKRLNGDNAEMAEAAAYVISQHGSAANIPLLRARLVRWRTEWGARVAEINLETADSNTRWQAIFERELILGLIDAKNWKLPPAEIAALKEGCLTKVCREYFQVRQQP